MHTTHQDHGLVICLMLQLYCNANLYTYSTICGCNDVYNFYQTVLLSNIFTTSLNRVRQGTQNVVFI